MSIKLQRLFFIASFVFTLSLACVPTQAQEAPTKSSLATAGEKTTPAAQVPEKKAEEVDENAAYRHSPTVIKLGGMMGMKPDTAATSFTVFNFAVLVILVGAFLLKTLPKAFRNRNTSIQKHLVDARTATEEATARLNKVEDRLSRLDEQIADMRAQSEADSKRDRERIQANLEEEKAKIIAAAEQEIASAAARAQRDLQRYAAELAIEQAARKLVVTAETDRLLVESFAHRLGSDMGGEN